MRVSSQRALSCLHQFEKDKASRALDESPLLQTTHPCPPASDLRCGSSSGARRCGALQGMMPRAHKCLEALQVCTQFKKLLIGLLSFSFPFAKAYGKLVSSKSLHVERAVRVLEKVPGPGKLETSSQVNQEDWRECSPRLACVSLGIRWPAKLAQLAGLKASRPELLDQGIPLCLAVLAENSGASTMLLSRLQAVAFAAVGPSTSHLSDRGFGICGFHNSLMTVGNFNSDTCFAEFGEGSGLGDSGMKD